MFKLVIIPMTFFLKKLVRDLAYVFPQVVR